MKVRIISILFIVACLGWVGLLGAAGASRSSGSGPPIQEIDPAQSLVEDLSDFIPAQMQAAQVPGLSIALIQDGEIVWVEGFGEANTLTRKAVPGDTVFEVASISKGSAG